jgi:transcription-repair coupling factor (superfamily II helicase)
MKLHDLKGISIDRIPFFLDSIDEIETNDIVFVTTAKTVNYLFSIMQNIASNREVILLNFFDSDIYENVCYDAEAFSKRAKALTEILFDNKKKIILTTIEAINYKVPEKKYFLERKKLSLKDNLKLSDLSEILLNFGYRRAEFVTEIGQFSVRGGIIDVFIPIMDKPVRIDFLGNAIESIREFSIDSQISTNNLEEVFITKCSEIILNKNAINLFKSKIKRDQTLITESVENGYFFNGIEWYLPYFHEKTVSILEYFASDAKFVFDFETSKINKEFIQLKLKQNDEIFSDSVSFIYENLDCIELNPFVDNNLLKEHNCKYNIRFEQDRDKLLNSINKKTIFSVSSKGAFSILSNILKDTKLNLMLCPLKKGFITDDFTIYTESELFGEILKSKIKTKSTDILKQYSKLSIGDHVVHEQHGVAIFEGLKNLNISGIQHDFLTLLYKDNDRLYVPIENISLISRYGSEQTIVNLDQLKSGNWVKRKGLVRKKLLTIANELLEIAAKRKLQNIPPIEIDSDEYDKFCKGFGHIETEDQQAAIDEAISDLKNSMPMDRLVCGDVGFGKTEVAMRAAFLIASAGRQIVLLAPTTILVSQHYKNFTKRFESFGIEICQLSRFISKKQLEQNIKEISSGKIKLIIATHAVLSSKIKFHNLGLIIVDEEQHFGVRQKEFLKSLREDVHFMTLSATPIPRTLQLAMSGIKDLSIIASPPIDRKSIKTIISDFDEEMIAKAIKSELETGGQVFFVTPRIEYLDEIYKIVAKLFPSISIEKAHGKMKNLEEVLREFCDGKTKILISTNIIDSGIDIPNANTILIHRCDLFGSSQLYQLKGRVGRSFKQAYAYFLLPKFKVLTENAKKRIEILKGLTSLGSGFSLASHDLDMRGAGNLVGQEQSGYIREVGVELYQTMLQEAILMIKAGNISDIEKKEPQINLGIPIYIPESYIDDANLRLSIYRRLGDLETAEELDSMEFELTDRFGSVPQEVLNTILIMKIKIYCRKANIEKIDVGSSGLSISFFDNNCKIKSLSDFFKSNAVTRNSGNVKIRQTRIVITKKWKNIIDRSIDILEIAKTAGKNKYSENLRFSEYQRGRYYDKS